MGGAEIQGHQGQGSRGSEPTSRCVCPSERSRAENSATVTLHAPNGWLTGGHVLR